ncbi:Repressor protein CI [Salmonella enterica]|nr:Repressor protein CI [Salmonella enterica]
MSTQKFTFRHMNDDMKAAVIQNRGGQKVIERILMAYGFKSRQAFCNHLGISQSTMANRYARDTFPADWVVICSMETGASIEWLAFGSGVKERMSSSSLEQHAEKQTEDGLCDKVHSSPTLFDNEIHMNFTHGGKAVIERIVEAYGYKTRQALADHLGISKSTLATRYMRDTFPADWVIQCAIETGVSITWLAFGKGDKIEKNSSLNCINIPKFTLNNAKLIESGSSIFDKNLLPENTIFPCLIENVNNFYICEKRFNNIIDGEWIVGIDGDISIRTITKLPNEKIQVKNKNIVFECSINEIEFLAKIVLSINNVRG